MKNLLLPVLLALFAQMLPVNAQIRILNFQGDSGYQHDSKDEANSLIESLGTKNGWEVVSTRDANDLNAKVLSIMDVVIFNNNCGTEGAIFSQSQQRALQNFIREGGGFIGVHCAGAIWNEEVKFQKWYEQLIGTRLVGHPEVQKATLTIENEDHIGTKHLPKKWQVKDEWHYFSSNPRGSVNVLISLEEDSYHADTNLKMGGDHPFTWYQYFDGGRSFFTSLGHTEEIYADSNFQKLIEGGIVWASGNGSKENFSTHGLILDLDADSLVVTNKKQEVIRWTNKISTFPAKHFEPNDYGIRLTMPGSGRPRIKKNVPQINNHNVLVFREDELINKKEDAFDYLIKGSGYTWFAVLRPYNTQNSRIKTEFGQGRLKDVNSFLGNLKNGGKYEGIWGSLEDDLTIWCGSRNGISFGRFDNNNPKVRGIGLNPNSYYIVAARMGAGVDTVDIELFVNEAKAIATKPILINSYSDSSKLAIGTERDATNHPGAESFDGEMARLLIYERPLNDDELKRTINYLSVTYDIKK